jgi:hypothetical protein
MSLSSYRTPMRQAAEGWTPVEQEVVPGAPYHSDGSSKSSPISQASLIGLRSIYHPWLTWAHGAGRLEIRYTMRFSYVSFAIIICKQSRASISQNGLNHWQRGFE